MARPAPLISADPRVLALAENAKKAQAFDIMCALLKDIALLEGDLAATQKSRARSSGINAIAMAAKISELKSVVMRIANGIYIA